MDNRLNKNQWVAVIAALAATALILWAGLSLTFSFLKGERGVGEKISSQSGGSPDFTKIPLFKESDISAKSLITEDLIVGTGKEAVKGRTVVVNYAGFLTDGTKFDSSWERNVHFELKLGEGS
ncbi:MAG: peptidyl-prolyl cis-trans isomerase, partial [Parcubacteria group bacterium Gr01-1014_107]